LLVKKLEIIRNKLEIKTDENRLKKDLFKIAFIALNSGGIDTSTIQL